MATNTYDLVNTWTTEVNSLLNKLRINSIELSERHRKNYYEYKHYNNYFDIPVIIMSVISSSFSVGASTYMKQEHVSVTTCGISMIIAMLTSIKLYLNLDKRLDNELEMSKAFHTLALELFVTLNLKEEQRNGNGLDYLNNIHNEYKKLIQSSALLRRLLKKDFMLEIDKRLLIDDNTSFSSECETPTMSKNSDTNSNMSKKTPNPNQHKKITNNFSSFTSKLHDLDKYSDKNRINNKNVKINDKLSINDKSSIYVDVDLYSNKNRNELLNRNEKSYDTYISENESDVELPIIKTLNEDSDDGNLSSNISDENMVSININNTSDDKDIFNTDKKTIVDEEKNMNNTNNINNMNDITKNISDNTKFDVIL